MVPQPSNEPQGIETYFTDVEEVRDIFMRRVAAPTLEKRLLIIHGVGGVGKTSLLRMFRLHCRAAHVPVALASGDVAKSAPEILRQWADDLRVDGLPLQGFTRTHDRYRMLIAKVEDKAGSFAKNLAKTITETVIDALPIPGIGPVLRKLGGMSAEALVDWLHDQGFAKSDIDLILEPAKRSTDDFLTDIGKPASTRRIVLMLDTYEKILSLEDWARDFAQRCHPNILLVISGRGIPKWDRQWGGWLAQADVQELKPMEPEVAPLLVRRYYATLTHSELAPDQAEGIVQFARGLPIAITSAVDLMVKYKARDFRAITPVVIADLAKRLQEDVPAELRPALQVAAIVRWFDEAVLRAVMVKSDVSADFEELQRFPFVVMRNGRFALHDVVRDTLDANLHARDSELHCQLHERAAAYFEAGITKRSGDEAMLFSMERLYHRICADEQTGIALFQRVAEEMAQFRLVHSLRSLLNDAHSYSRVLSDGGRLWMDYYDARLTHLESRLVTAEAAYQSISENEHSEPKLRAYALSDRGQILEIFGQHSRSIPILQRSLSLWQLDSHLAISLIELCHASRRIGGLDQCDRYLVRARDYYAGSNDKYGLVYALNAMKYHYLNQGLTHRAVDCQEQSKAVLRTISPTSKYLYWDMLSGAAVYWAWLLGRLNDAEQSLKQALEAYQELGIVDRAAPERDLAYVLGMQGKFAEAEEHFGRATAISKQAESANQEPALGMISGFRGAVLGRRGATEEAEKELKTSLGFKQRINDFNGIPELCLWLGELQEIRAKQNGIENNIELWKSAQSYYDQALDLRWTGRRYFVCGNLIGLIRVKYAQGDLAAVPPLLAEAEQLAQQCEYNDHLASLRLTQGQMALDWKGEVSAPLERYQQVLIYALRFNRFLLDEVLSGRPQCTPLQPIVPYLIGRGQEGCKMLVSLREWWCNGRNDIGTPRPDTISPIPEGISLLEAERMAREREPGDGSLQKSVVEQIDLALGA